MVFTVIGVILLIISWIIGAITNRTDRYQFPYEESYIEYKKRMRKITIFFAAAATVFCFIGVIVNWYF